MRFTSVSAPSRNRPPITVHTGMALIWTLETLPVGLLWEQKLCPLPLRPGSYFLTENAAAKFR